MADQLQRISQLAAERGQTCANCNCSAQGYKYVSSRLACMSQQVKSSPAEFKALFNRIRTGNFTVREFGQGAKYSIILIGAFAIGEAFGRRSLIGYKVGERPGSGEHH